MCKYSQIKTLKTTDFTDHLFCELFTLIQFKAANEKKSTLKW